MHFSLFLGNDSMTQLVTICNEWEQISNYYLDGQTWGCLIVKQDWYALWIGFVVSLAMF